MQYADFQFTQPITAEFIKLNEGGGLKDLALSTHGVNNGQALKTGPVWSLVSGSQSDRDAVLKMLAELDRWHGLPNGMFSCDEHLAGRDPSHGSELCTVVESMFSLEQSLAITGHAALADRLEKLAFNALPGTFTDDMWAHQYNQEPNQVECSLHHKTLGQRWPRIQPLRPRPQLRLLHRQLQPGMAQVRRQPLHALWLIRRRCRPGRCRLRPLRTPHHPPRRPHSRHRRNRLSVPWHHSPSPSILPRRLSFPLSLRIPAWAGDETALSVNGRPWIGPVPKDFARLQRTWRAGDRVELTLPMQPRVSRWFNNSVAIERGPLVFSYAIGEDWVKLRDQGMTADWQVFPTTPWNYAIEFDPANPAGSIVVSESAIVAGAFTKRHTSVSLSLKARQLPAWQADDGAANPLPQSPVASDQPLESLTLIPYAAAKLRITAFPQAGT